MQVLFTHERPLAQSESEAQVREPPPPTRRFKVMMRIPVARVATTAAMIAYFKYAFAFVRRSSSPPALRYRKAVQMMRPIATIQKIVMSQLTIEEAGLVTSVRPEIGGLETGMPGTICSGLIVFAARKTKEKNIIFL
jgi:hypothetical protein